MDSVDEDVIPDKDGSPGDWTKVRGISNKHGLLTASPGRKTDLHIDFN